MSIHKTKGWDDDDSDFVNMQLLCYEYVAVATYSSDVSSVCINYTHPTAAEY